MVSATLALSHMSPGKAASLLAQMNPDRATSNLLQVRARPIETCGICWWTPERNIRKGRCSGERSSRGCRAHPECERSH